MVCPADMAARHLHSPNRVCGPRGHSADVQRWGTAPLAGSETTSGATGLVREGVSPSRPSGPVTAGRGEADTADSDPECCRSPFPQFAGWPALTVRPVTATVPVPSASSFLGKYFGNGVAGVPAAGVTGS